MTKQRNDIIKIFVFIWYIPRNIAIGLVIFYQKLFSPDYSFWAKWVKWQGHCKYHPSCSEYMKKSLQKYGLIRGFLKGMWRVCRCNPWSDGGIDMP
jgi:putative component of membrane protein insertase Oxa1/YidC/SpoIIIJ protein YidD